MKLLCSYCNKEINTETQGYAILVFPSDQPEQYVIYAHLPDCLAHLIKQAAQQDWQLNELPKKVGNMEIKVTLPRDDLMLLAHLATTRNETTRVTASKIIREYVATQQNMHLITFGISIRRGLARLLIKLAYWLTPISNR